MLHSGAHFVPSLPGTEQILLGRRGCSDFGLHPALGPREVFVFCGRACSCYISTPPAPRRARLFFTSYCIFNYSKLLLGDSCARAGTHGSERTEPLANDVPCEHVDVAKGAAFQHQCLACDSRILSMIFWALVVHVNHTLKQMALVCRGIPQLMINRRGARIHCHTLLQHVHKNRAYR